MPKSKTKKLREIQKHEKIVIAKYIRVSTYKQREEGYSVQIQQDRLSGYTKSMYPESQYNVEYREYIDDGFTGATLDRPRMSDLIRDVQNGQITHIVIVRLDRLSRSQKDTLYLIEDVFLPNNVVFISMDESFNTETQFGRAMVGVLSVFAQLERENIFERTRSGMQKRVEFGYWPGGGMIPFGYDYDAQEGILVPNKDASTVRRMYDLYLQGFSMQRIANMCGLKYSTVVSQILSRKSNTGAIVYNGIEYCGKHEPIISTEIYQQTMDMMLERSVKKRTSATHLLTGLVYCGKCSAKMRYQNWGNAGSKFMCYSQQKSKPYLIKDPDCDNAKPWTEDVEAFVISSIFQRTNMKMKEIRDALQKSDVLQTLEVQKRNLTEKLKRLYNLYALADDDALISTIHDTQNELAALDQARQKILCKRSSTKSNNGTKSTCIRGADTP